MTFIKFNLNYTTLNEIIHIFGNIESTKKADHILEMPRSEVSCKFVSLIRLLKLGLKINTANYFKDQRRPSISLASVMFRGTTYLSLILVWIIYITFWSRSSGIFSVFKLSLKLCFSLICYFFYIIYLMNILPMDLTTK